MQIFDIMKPINPIEYLSGPEYIAWRRDAVLIELLRQVDIRNTTLFIAAQYANMYNTVWKDTPALIHKFYSTHQRELSLFIKMKLDRVVNRLLEAASKFCSNMSYLNNVELDAATASCIDNTLRELENRSNIVDLNNTLLTTVDDLLAGKPVVTTSILSELEVLESVIRGNKEKYKLYGQQGWRSKPRTSLPLLINKICTILADVVRNVRYKSSDVCYNYKEWASLLSIVYMLYMSPIFYREMVHIGDSTYLRNEGEYESNPYLNLFTSFTPEEAICDCGHLKVSIEAYEKTHRGIRERCDNPLVKEYIRAQYSLANHTDTGVRSS